MARPASQPSALDTDSPSLDPAAIERAYLRERARRRARHRRRTAARSDAARFWVVIAVVMFLTVLIALATWREVQTIFGL